MKGKPSSGNITVTYMTNRGLNILKIQSNLTDNKNKQFSIK